MSALLAGRTLPTRLCEHRQFACGWRSLAGRPSGDAGCAVVVAGRLSGLRRERSELAEDRCEAGAFFFEVCDGFCELALALRGEP